MRLYRPQEQSGRKTKPTGIRGSWSVCYTSLYAAGARQAESPFQIRVRSAAPLLPADRCQTDCSHQLPSRAEHRPRDSGEGTTDRRECRTPRASGGTGAVPYLPPGNAGSITSQNPPLRAPLLLLLSLETGIAPRLPSPVLLIPS